MVVQFSSPLIVDGFSRGQVRRLVRVRPNATHGSSAHYVEDFLQRIIDAEPEILPVEELEASFSGLRSVCRELPLGRGENKYLDNLLMNANGRICLVECKLWRNPEAIREVVAQILDYAGELSTMSYEELQAAVRRALRLPSGDPLIEKVLGQGYDEYAGITFIDAVTRSLQTGNFLLLVVGDGIRAGLQQIAGLLQNRATLGFSFALIEMAIYGTSAESGPYYVQPRRLLRTETVVRNVFQLGQPALVSTAPGQPSEPRPQSMSEREFFDELGKIDATLPARLQAFLDRCEAIGCRPELRRKYVLYVDDPTGGQFNIGTIAKDGFVFIQGAASRDTKFGTPIGRSYMEGVAGFLPNGEVVSDPNNVGNNHVRMNDRMGIPLHVMLEHEAEWLQQVQTMIDALRRIDTEQD